MGQVDSARDALLLSSPPSVSDGPAEALLLDVASGRVVARCPGLRVEVTDSTSYFKRRYASPLDGRLPTVFTDFTGTNVTLPPLSGDRRMALDQPDGVVDLVSGTTYADPDRGWRSVGFAGDAILRQRRPAPGAHLPQGMGYVPGTFCVAARPDTPQRDCVPIAGATENGLPSVTDAGAVEWAPDSREVPLVLRRADGATYTGLAQVGPTRIADLHIASVNDPRDPIPPPHLTYYGALPHYTPLGRNETVLSEPMTSRGTLEPAPSDPGPQERISWFADPAVTATGVTADLHMATTTWAQALAAADAVTDAPLWASVIDSGTAALLVLPSPPLHPGQALSFSFVRVPETGPPAVVARLGMTAGGPPSDTDLGAWAPIVLSWP